MQHAVRSRAGLAGVCLAALCAPTPAWSQAGPAGLDQRTWLQLDATAARVRSVSQSYDIFDTPYAPPVDTEQTLGTPRSGTVWAGAFGRRIGERWRIEFGLARERRDGSTVLAQDTNVDGIVYAGGSTLRSRTQLRQWRVQGGFSFLLSDTAEAGLSFGGHGLTLARQLRGTPAGSSPPDRVVDDSLREGVVLPLLGLYGTVALAPSWQLAGRLDLTPGEDYAAASATLLWRAAPNLAIGLGYQVLEANIDVTWGFLFVDRTVLDYRRHGPTLSVLLGF